MSRDITISGYAVFDYIAIGELNTASVYGYPFNVQNLFLRIAGAV